MLYKDLYKYRSVWMGFAILWVFFFHIGIDINFLPIRIIHSIGYAGCDIFLFASGIGIYYSLEKNADLALYLKKRITRLMPIFWVVLLSWIPFRFYIGEMTWQAAIGNFLGIQYFVDWRYDYNWYIPVMLLCYVLAPFFKKIIDRYQSIILNVIVVTLLIVMSYVWSDDVMMMTGMTRIAIFVIGMFFGQKGCQEKKISQKTIISWIVLIPIGLGVTYYSYTYLGWTGWKTGLNWLPLILSTPGLCILLSLIAMRIKNNKIGESLNSLIGKAGNHSLEIYFAHVTAVLVFRDYMIKNDPSLDTVVNWLILIAVSIVATVLLYYIQKGINKAFSSKKGS